MEDDLKIEMVKVNGDVFENDGKIRWYDDIKAYAPNDSYPYWQIDFYKGGNVIRRLQAAGSVSVTLK